MQICKRCLLNDNIPSVRINDSGLCNYCASSGGTRPGRNPVPETELTRNPVPETELTRNPVPETELTRNPVDEEFEALLERYKHRKYQVIMAYSGGKDSTYTLKMVREKYDASILAVTFDNCFLSGSCMKNINSVTDRLGVDSMIVKYPCNKLLKAFKFIESGNVFPKTSLERASSICNLCIMLIKNMIYYEAIIRDIPIICFGWTPGQVETVKPLLRLNYRMVSKVFEHVRNAIVSELGSGYEKYFLNDGFMKENEDRMPYLYYPFVNNAYNEMKILDEIREIGWESPENTDGNSSNCLLNSYANQCHVDRFGYHPYAFEISNMVRNGYMSREEGAGKLEKVKNDNTFEQIKSKFENS